jgi:hypothetical protein
LKHSVQLQTLERSPTRPPSPSTNNCRPLPYTCMFTHLYCTVGVKHILLPQPLHIGTELQNYNMAHENWTDHTRIRSTFSSSNNKFRNLLKFFRCSKSQPFTRTDVINRDTCTDELKAVVVNEQLKPMRLAYITKYVVLYYDILQLTLLSSVNNYVTSLTHIDLV